MKKKLKETYLRPIGGREVCRKCEAYYSIFWMNEYEEPTCIPKFCPYCGHSPSWKAPIQPEKNWTSENLIAAVQAGTTDEKLALLKKIGILTEDGQLSEKYGGKPS